MRDYSPADSADHAEECSKAALFRRERQVGIRVVIAVIGALGFVVRLRHLRDLRETLGFPLCGLIEYACVLFSRRLRRSRRGNAASCIISQIKTGCSLFVYGKLCKFA